MLSIKEQFELGRMKVIASGVVDAALPEFKYRLETRLKFMLQQIFQIRFDRGPSLFEKLPPELYSAIFRGVLATSRPASREYRDDRTRIILVCKLWQAVMTKDPLCWSEVTIMPNMTSRALRQILEVTVSQPLAVYVLDLRVTDDQHTAADHSILLSLFNQLLPTCRRWVKLVIVTPSLHVRSFVLRKVRNYTCPSLTSIVAYAPLSGSYPIPSSLTGQLLSTTLRCLVLHRIPFPQWTPVPMPSLQILSLSDIISFNSPTKAQLYALLANSPQLCTLELLRVGVSLPEHAASPRLIELTVPSVTTLALAFDATLNSVIALIPFFDALRFIDMPNLRHYHLEFPTDEDARCYLTNFLSFRSPSVSLGGRLSNADVIQTLLVHLGMVDTLDLVEYQGKELLECLGTRLPKTSGHSGVVLPALQTLRVRAHFLRSLYMGLIDRSSRGSLVRSVEMVRLDGDHFSDLAAVGDQLNDIRAVAHSVRWGSKHNYVTGVSHYGILTMAYLRVLPMFVAARLGLASLPTEVLAKILLLVPDRFENVPVTWRWSCVLLGWVCKKWMSIVNSYPEFFSGLYIYPGTSLSLLERSLRCSGDYPLAITIEFPPINSNNTISRQMHEFTLYRSLVDAVFQRLRSDMGRCTRLVVDVDDHRLMRRIFTKLNRMNGGNITEFSVSSAHYMGRFTPSVASPFLASMPKLRAMNVRYHAVVWTNLSFLSGLTRLTIHSFFDVNPTLGFIYDMLEAAPCLEYLGLVLLSMADLEDVERDPPVLQFLTELDVVADSEEGTCLLSLLDVPALRILRFKVEDGNDRAIAGLFGHCWRVGPQVTTLGLQVSLPSVQLLLRCFALFPNVQSLDVRGINVGFGVHLMAIAMHWPQRLSCVREVLLDDYLEDPILTTLLEGLSGDKAWSVRVISPHDLDVIGWPTVPVTSTLKPDGTLDRAPYCTTSVLM
ncbi:hypothetical protein R3P38DRAFT_2761872 [Favolaschia claudopus]|uniref:F-box domain-containing protein n=1 Tax=Favolaschia claudopus TaxID=2862362 RepID=A0AAW0DR59_9AGAR